MKCIYIEEESKGITERERGLGEREDGREQSERKWDIGSLEPGVYIVGAYVGHGRWHKGDERREKEETQ